MVLSGDDRIEPVLAFSDAGDLSLETSSPLREILEHHTAGYHAALKVTPKPPRTHGGVPALTDVQMRWQSLLGHSSSVEMRVASITDPRVDPLVGTRWNQGAAQGLPTYNFYVPNYYPTGCVATAMSQLMRFHSWPLAGIGQLSFPITVDKVSQNASTRGGDGIGGPYDWTKMPLVPNSATTDAERRMIGALMVDAGSSVNMAYAADGSGTDTLQAGTALRTTFKYANAIRGYASGTELTGRGLDRMILPNLDAGLPVLLGITGTPGGHAIVCDGYGYIGANLYHHLNMGWSGSSDAWYLLPDIDFSSSQSFDTVYKCVYNVYPAGTGEIVSGRILDEAGAPISGVTVSNGMVTTTTNVRGIYGLPKVATGWQTLTATKVGASFPSARILVGKSEDGPVVGNRWGINLVQNRMSPTFLTGIAAQEVKVGSKPTDLLVEVAGAPTVHYAWARNGLVVGVDAPTFAFSAPVTRADNGTSLSVKATNDHGSADSTANLNVVDLYNAGFERGLEGWQAFSPDMYSEASEDVLPYGGKIWLYVGDWATPKTDWAQQSVAIPASATSASVSFWLGIKNRPAVPTGATNLFTLKVLDEAKNPVETLVTKDNRDEALGSDGTVIWKKVGPFSLLTHKGKTVYLQFASVQPGGKDTGTIFATDDVEVAIGEGFATSVSPASCTVVPGGTWAFKARVEGTPTDNRVNWTATGGSLAPTQTAGDGVAATTYTSPSTLGTYTVTATPVTTGGTAASATVTVVDPTSVQVNLLPITTSASINTPVAFTASVSLLSQNTVSWTCSGGSFSATTGGTATWSAPAAGTFTIRALAAGAPTRMAEATVTVTDPSSLNLVMTPLVKTLLPGASGTFSITGDNGGGVTWACTGGLLPLVNGLSAVLTVPGTAPLATQAYTLTATSKLNASKSAAAAITVKGVDLNADGVLDLQDLLTLAAEYGKSSTSPANFKGQDTVNDSDLNTLLSLLK